VRGGGRDGGGRVRSWWGGGSLVGPVRPAAAFCALAETRNKRNSLMIKPATPSLSTPSQSNKQKGKVKEHTTQGQRRKKNMEGGEEKKKSGVK